MSFPCLSRLVATLPPDGSFSIWVGPLNGPAWFSLHPRSQHYAASTMKLALAMAAFREADEGRLDLARTVTVHNEFRSALDGSPFSMDSTDDSDPEPWDRLASQVTLRWLAYRALVRSSNLATNLLLDVVGVPAVSDLLAATGSDHSIVSRGIEDTKARDAGRQNLVTAEDLAHQLQALAGSQVVSAAGSRELLDVLAAQQINDAIPVRLPAGVRIEHKSGWVDGISHDAGIIYPPDAGPFIFVMCTTSNLDEPSGLDVIATAALAAWDDRRLAA